MQQFNYRFFSAPTWIMLLCLLTSLHTKPVFAQNVSNPYSNAMAPIFYIPDFEGDMRKDDLYGYLHPIGWPAWSTYDMYVTQIMMADAQSLATVFPVTGGTGAIDGYGYNNYGLAYTGLNSVNTGTNVATTNVTGVIEPSAYASAPGLVQAP